jgi:hypothetical protein
MNDGHALLSRLVLFRPDVVEDRLRNIEAARVVRRTPNVWQITLGVLRMWHRVLFRSETIGMCASNPVRDNWRARVLQYRPIRFPFLLAERAVAPWDFSGLLSSSERVISHLLGAHHDANQFAYDLQMLAIEPGTLADLRRAVASVIADDTPRSQWLRDLAVFDGYHESLLAAVDRALAGDLGLHSHEDQDPDISFFAYLDWCARQPATPRETWEAWRSGRFTLSSRPDRSSRTLGRDFGEVATCP